MTPVSRGSADLDPQDRLVAFQQQDSVVSVSKVTDRNRQGKGAEECTAGKDLEAPVREEGAKRGRWQGGGCLGEREIGA